MHHFCIFILLIAQLTLSSAGQVRVLCIGSDGHVSIEQAHAVCDQNAASVENHCLPELDCAKLCVSAAPCDDLPLPVPQTQLTARNQQDNLNIAIALALQWTGTLQPIALPASIYAQTAFDDHAPWHRHQIHLTLASTILQI